MLRLLAAFLALTLNLLAETGRYRLTWTNDPATTATIGWEQSGLLSENPLSTPSVATVFYSSNPDNLPASFDAEIPTAAIAHPYDTRVNGVIDQARGKGMDNRFAYLTGLQPDTAYYFVIRDSVSQSRMLWFLTAPDSPKEFSFIAGGDSRHGDPNPLNEVNEGRRAANEMVAKIRPLFIAFNGDMTFSSFPEEWQLWFDDWQLTIADDGRLFPIVPARGNHEYLNDALASLFGVPDASTTDDPSAYYYALSFGGNLLRSYQLNSEYLFGEGNAQGEWLESDLQENGTQHLLKVANYHKPMRPHESSKSEGSGEYEAWSEIFYHYGVDLAVESDSHCAKRTFPIRPSLSDGASEGFIRDDTFGTVYIGEGCWGAPLREADDNKPWTLASGSFNHFDHITVLPPAQSSPARLEVRTILADSVSETIARSASEELADPSGLPEGVQLWQPDGGEVLHIPFTNDGPSITSVSATGSFWKFNDDGEDLTGTNWNGLTYDDSGWSRGPSQFGYGEDDEATEVDEERSQPAGSSRVITTYFRREFEFTALAETDQLDFNLISDDGAIVYLNGTEVFRHNLPSGEINASTTASANKGGAEGNSFSLHSITETSSLLWDGRNVVAVELHQEGGLLDSDASFDLRLNAVRQSSPGGPDGPYLAASPVNDTSVSLLWESVPEAAAFQLERRCAGSQAWALVSASLPGQSTTYSDTGLDADTSYAYRIRYYDGSRFSQFSSESFVTTLSGEGGSEPLITRGEEWQYLETVHRLQNPPANWENASYAGDVLPRAFAPLGFNHSSARSTLIDTDNTTYYFRRHFEIPNASAITSLTLELMADDGAVVYLNGIELVRDNMPASGNIGSNTEAETSRLGSEEDNYRSFNLSPAVLIDGSNLIAVEVHQAADLLSGLPDLLGLAGPDLLFDASLTAEINPQIPLVTLSGGGTLDEETGTSAPLVVNRTGQPYGSLAVQLTRSGHATDEDFTPSLNTLTIPSGQNSALVQLTAANDGEAEGLEAFVIAVSASSAYLPHAPNTATYQILDAVYDQWQFDHYGGNRSDEFDGDGDGIPSCLEFAFGLDPHTPDRQEIEFNLVQEESGIYLETTIRQRTDTNRLSYGIQQSDDLRNWDEVTANFEPQGNPVATADDAIVEFTYRLTTPIPLAQEPRQFFRATVTKN
ncbi:MAG: metallophosphoesterase [Verrucomicrobiota bacterium JB023]|nr:metallophosphoesterase [Verrucomicrobiota bacterium JB023]